MQYVQVTEDDCNVQTITRFAKEAFGVYPLVLVVVNALKIENRESTRRTQIYISNKNFTKQNLFSIFCYSHGNY